MAINKMENIISRRW